MNTDLEEMRKAYKSDDDIRHKLINTAENGLNFDRTWNGVYKLLLCGDFNGPLLGHRPEKCRSNRKA